MRRPTAPAPASFRMRRYLFPLLAVVVGLALFDRAPWERGFDVDSLRSQLREGQVESALESLARAPQGALLPELHRVNWWPSVSRARKLASLEAEADALPLPTRPELLLPSGRLRQAPGAARLSRPADGALHLELHASALGMSAGEVEIEPGQVDVPLGATILIGTSYDLALIDAEGSMLSVLHFEVLPSASSRDVGIVMASAHELAGGGAPGDLLAAIVCVHFGLYQESLTRLEALEPDPQLGDVARELRAVALSRLGRPHDALDALASR